MGDIKLADLLPAPAQNEQPTPAAEQRTRHEIVKIRKQAMARLVAQEYVRNGMDLISAYNTVNHTHYVKNSQTMYRILGKGTDDFIDELNRLLAKTDISRDRALNILWAMVNASILDFLDEHGRVLPVKELKKLPRVMQLLISKISVKTTQKVAVDPDTKKPLLDDMGRPYLLTESSVRIEIPDKLTAFRQLAEVMRWVGPAVVINHNTVNIGLEMEEANARARRLNHVYDGVVVDPPHK